jgi:hypothetical protein
LQESFIFIFYFPVKNRKEIFIFLEFKKCAIVRPGTVAQACNPSYSGSGDWKDCGSQANLGKKILETLISSWARSYMPVVPALQEAEVGGLQVRPA